jgi:hypothetical protein
MTSSFVIDIRLTQTGVKSTAGIALKTWTHVTCKFDGEKLSLYIDGKLDAERKTKGKILFSKMPFFIGKIPQELTSESNYGMEGMIKNMQLYYRPLNQNEIKENATNEQVRFHSVFFIISFLISTTFLLK